MPKTTKTMDSVFPKAPVPRELYFMFGPRPVWPGENIDAFKNLFEALAAAAAIDPKDLIGWVYIKDVTDLTLEIQRLYRFKLSITHNARDEVQLEIFQQLLAPDISPLEILDRAREMNVKFLNGDDKVVAEMQALMKRRGYDEGSITAGAFAKQIGIIEVIDSMMAGMINRRTKLLHEIERHQAVLATRLRVALETQDAPVPKEIAPTEAPSIAPDKDHTRDQ